MPPSFSLADRVAIVTGASSIIGAAIARTFVDAGAKVVLASRKLDALQQVTRELGDSAHPFAAHTGKEADCAALPGTWSIGALPAPPSTSPPMRRRTSPATSWSWTAE